MARRTEAFTGNECARVCVGVMGVQSSHRLHCFNVVVHRRFDIHAYVRDFISYTAQTLVSIRLSTVFRMQFRHSLAGFECVTVIDPMYF